MNSLKVAGFALLAFSMPLGARNWPDAGGWEVFEVGADTCGMALEYEGKGETQLVLLQGTDSSVTLSVANYAWTTVPKEKYELAFYLDGTAFGGGASVGISLEARKGFITSFTPDFLKHFEASKNLKIRGPKDILVDSLDLDGSAAGLAQLRRCVAQLRSIASAAAREKARFAHIPDDPFAQLRGERAPKPGEAVPSVAIVSLISADDYPQAARDNNQQGNVAFRLTISATGRVADCIVTRSSGSAILDRSTCSIMTQRARFTPAKSASGDTMIGTYESAVSWTLNEPVPPVQAQ